MKDKIIEILLEGKLLPTGVHAYTKIMLETEEIASRIDSLYSTLDRDKVMEIGFEIIKLSDEYDSTGEAIYTEQELLEKLADALCSLAIPSVSEEEIDKMAEKNSHFWMSDSKRLVAIEAFKNGFKACKELLNHKR